MIEKFLCIQFIYNYIRYIYIYKYIERERERGRVRERAKKKYPETERPWLSGNSDLQSPTSTLFTGSSNPTALATTVW